jgi:gluconolactonase
MKCDRLCGVALLALAAGGCGSSNASDSRTRLFAGPVEVVADGLGFTEGPVWLPANSELVFSDIPNAKLMAWSQAGGLRVYREEANPNGNVLDGMGRLLTCRHGARDLVRTGADGSIDVIVGEWDGKRLNSPNDLAVDRDGVIWFTDPPWGLEGQTEGREIDGNYVYRVDPSSGTAVNVSSIHAMPNGIAFSPDYESLYVSDTGGLDSHPDVGMRSAPALITKFEVQRDASGRGQNLAVLWQVPGRSDGMAVDAEGRVYTTARSGIVVFDPEDGAVIAELALDEAPTNCCFGGADGKTLFITARSTVYSIAVSTPGASYTP